MIDQKTIEFKLEDQALKEKMILEAILILSTVEWIQNQIELKLLELDDHPTNTRRRDITGQIISLLSKLINEEDRMDEYMAKYRRIINEKKALLFGHGKEKQAYLRGVPPNERGSKKSKSVSVRN